MTVRVHKYGGSSVASPQKISEIASRLVALQKSGQKLCVVVSAMGKSTDQLLKLAQEVSTVPPQRELDMLVTAGERISMALMSMAIDEAGGSARSFTGSQSGIITNDVHQGAEIVAVRPTRIQATLDAGHIAIVAGYQGVSEHSKEVTTLGRGGTDTSAVALAAALGADLCEIYSDVDGVYSADPRVCPQAKHLATIDFQTMKTMAEAGAKVLNANAIAFAEKAGIEIHALKTGDASMRHTRLSAVLASANISAVVHNEKVLQVFGDFDAVLAARQMGAKWSVLERDGERARGVLDCTDVSGGRDILAKRLAGLRLSLWDEVSIVGFGLDLNPDSQRRILDSLKNIDYVHLRIFSNRWSFFVKDGALRVQELHRVLVEEQEG